MLVYVMAASSLARNLHVPGNWYRYKNSGGQFQHMLHEGATAASGCCSGKINWYGYDNARDN